MQSSPDRPAQSAPEPSIAEGPLGGYRVLDLCGPLGVYCTKLLADLGADVLRVEPPAGDPMRARPPRYTAPDGSEHSLYYAQMNTSKRAVSLDLAPPRGRELFLQLVERADVVVEDFTPGYRASLGLDYAALRARNAGLVLTSITPFGQTGPYAAYRDSDLVGQAMGGVLALTGYADGTPLRLACDQGYYSASLHACVGTLVALYHRDATGEGQHVDASMQETVAVTMQPATQHWDLKAERLGHDNLRFGGTTPCKDGHVAIAMGRLQALERAATWLADEGLFAGLDAARWDDPAWVATTRQQVAEGMRTLFARHTKAELFQESLRRDVWLSPVHTAEDVADDPQLAARGFFQPVAYPELGVTLSHPGAPFQMSASPWRIAHRAPLPGEHDDAVFGDELGLSAAERGALQRERIIGASPQPPPTSPESVANQQPPAAHPTERPIESGAPAATTTGNLSPAATTASNASPTANPTSSAGVPTQYSVLSTQYSSPGAPHSVASTQHSSPGALRGIRILDFTWVAAGPLAAKLLGDHGAEVILVESAMRRGGLRAQEPMPPDKRGENVSGWFNFLNTNKLGITVNMKRPEGVELIRRLVQISDVVLDNYTPGVMGRWGLDYDSLAALKPDIIVMSMPVMGTTGPKRQIGGFGSTPLGLSGIHHLTQLPGRGPAGCNHAYADQASNAGHGAAALLAALLYRRRTGRGQFIDLAQYESTANFAGPYLFEYLATGTARQPTGNHTPEAAPHNAYRCADDADGTPRWCVIAAYDDADWQALRRALDDPAWARDARFATHAGRKTHEEALDGHLAAWTAERAPADVMALLQAHGVAAGIVQDGRDLLDRDPHLRARGHFLTLDHPELGPARYHRLGFTLSATPAEFRPAPLLGQHNRQVLSELLGLSEAEIRGLEEAGVLD